MTAAIRNVSYTSNHRKMPLCYVDGSRERKSTSLGNLNIRDIYLNLMNDESNNSSSTGITTPRLRTNSGEMQSSSNSLENSLP